MAKDTIDIVLASVQIVTLIALIIYVWKTWDMAVSTEHAAKISESTLQEMKDARDQEVAPYVVAYFEIPYGKLTVNLVVKNVGKSLAEDVKIEFDPKLINSRGKKIGEYTFIKKGIGSIPPGYEIKTFFDISRNYFENEELPLEYKARITYKGGIKKESRVTEQVLDLSTFKDLSFIDENGLNELVKEIKDLKDHNKKISNNLENISNRIKNGIWIKNNEILIDNLVIETDLWINAIKSTLIQFKYLWNSIYAGEKELVNPFLTNFQNKISFLSEEILLISSKHPKNVSSGLMDNLIEISSQLMDLGEFRFFGDGGLSIMKFNNSGDEIIKLIDDAIEEIESFEDHESQLLIL